MFFFVCTKMHYKLFFAEQFLVKNLVDFILAKQQNKHFFKNNALPIIFK